MSTVYSTVSVTSNIDMDTNSYSGYNYFFVNCASNNITITLPALANCFNGLAFKFARIDTNLLSLTTFTLTAKSGTTINGNTSQIIPLKTNVEIVYFNGQWFSPLLSFT